MAADLRRALDRIAQGFLAHRDMADEAACLEQLANLVFLALLDEEEEATDQDSGDGESRQLFPGQAARYRWSRWKRKRGTELCDFLGEEVFAYMASLVKDAPRVAAYFRDATLELRDPALLEQAIDELDAIALHALGPRVTGDAFEHLLGRLGRAPTGWIRTPRWLRALVLEMTEPGPGDRICDPACGTGGFLVEAIAYLRARYGDIPPDVMLGGIEVSPRVWRLATMNLLLHGARHADLRLADALSEHSGLSQEDREGRYTLVLSTPPFGGQLSPRVPVRQDLPVSSRKLELLFLALAMASLAPGGRCAVVVPASLLFSAANAPMALRRRLVEDFDLLAVIALPAGAFRPQTTVKTAVLVFRRPQASAGRSVDRVWFYELAGSPRADRAAPPDAPDEPGEPEEPDESAIAALLAEWRQHQASGFARPPGAQAGTVLAPGSEPPRCWWAPVETIAESGYDLSAARHAPILDRRSDEDPAALIREVLAMERDIQEGLEKLLGEVETAS